MQYEPRTDRRDDDGMVADFLAGTSAGLERVYGCYGRLLYSVARHVLADDADAQDCVHDTLLRVWQRPASFRPERGALRSYLVVAVRNDALSRRRDTVRHGRLEERATRDVAATYEIEVADPIERTRLRAALAALPPEQKAALELAYFGQLTHVQVAERLGAPLGTTKSRIALGLRKLGAALAGTGGIAS